MEESKKKKEDQQYLKYFDSEWFQPTEVQKDLDIFLCPICIGVVINPLECTNPTCVSLYCEACIGKMIGEKKCPKKCGSKTFQQPHKFVKHQMLELKFKCPNSRWCKKDKLPYLDFQKHYL